MDESPAASGWPQIGILLRRGHLYVPHRPDPGGRGASRLPRGEKIRKEEKEFRTRNNKGKIKDSEERLKDWVREKIRSYGSFL